MVVALHFIRSAVSFLGRIPNLSSEEQEIKALFIAVRRNFESSSLKKVFYIPYHEGIKSIRSLHQK